MRVCAKSLCPRFGNLRKNVGGRPKKAARKDEGFGSNSKKDQDKRMRLEIHGKVQFTRIVGSFAAKLADSQHILAPIWGGKADGELHWTLLSMSKIEETWEVEYKDSLTQVHKDCWENAEKILTVLAVALNAHKARMPKARSNAKFQPKGSGLCGQFVCHYTEVKVREIMGEGPHSIGHANVAKINLRVGKLMSLVILNKGFAAIHQAKAAKLKKTLEDAKTKEEEARRKLAESKDFQEKTKISAGLKLLIPWATEAGCAKCRWKVEGSTCCNPEKMLAKQRAQKAWIDAHGAGKEGSDGNYDVQVYHEKLQEIYQEILKKHTSPVDLPELPKKAGGDLEVGRKKTILLTITIPNYGHYYH